MNKQVLSPFDCDMCAMIEDITKQEIEVTASDTLIRLSWAQNGSEGNDKAEGQRIDALNAYGKANQLRKKMANAPEPGKDDCDCPACTLRRTLQGKAQPGGKEYRKPEAFDVPKEVEAMAAFFADMFPGSEIQIQRVDLKKNPRNKRRAKNQRKNRKGGNK